MKKILCWAVFAAGFVYMAAAVFILIHTGNMLYGFTAVGVMPAAVIISLRIDGYGCYPFTIGWR